MELSRAPRPVSTDQLSRERQVSVIPSRHGPWLYPSEYQFYQTARAKGQKVDSSDMKVAVAVHNSINDYAWKSILAYENLHRDTCATPQLVRFTGISDVTTLRARLRTFLGYMPPFDTHEWIVDRCGHHVRYFIDYYDGPGRPFSGQPVSVFVDARPAPTIAGVIDQVKLFWFQWFRSYCPVERP